MTRAQRKDAARKEVARRIRNGTLQPGARERFPVLMELLVASRPLVKEMSTTINTHWARRKLRDENGKVLGHTTIERKKVTVHPSVYGPPTFRNVMEPVNGKSHLV